MSDGIERMPKIRLVSKLDLIYQVAALEAELLDKEEALRWVYRTHILNGMTYEEWYSQTLKRASEWIEPGEEAGDDSSRLRAEAAAARVAELEAEVAAEVNESAEQVKKRVEAEAELMFRTEQRDDLLKRLEQAEARVTALDIQLRDADHENIGLKAEVGRLRCCGNCEHYDHTKSSYDECEEECDSRPTDDTPYPEGYDHDKSLFDGMNAWDSCHWTLARWAAREE